MVLLEQVASGHVLSQPLYTWLSGEGWSLHVGFLADKPEPARVKLLDPKRSPPDEFEVKGREVYFHFPNGLGRSKLTNLWFDKELATLSTVRNWNTVLELSKRLG